MEPDLSGMRFGHLLVLGRAGDYRSPGGTRARRWRCRCDCGREKPVLEGNLLSGNSRSCGCAAERKRREGMAAARSSRRSGPGSAMREARLKQGWSVRKLSLLSGVSRTSILSYEAGRRTPLLTTALRLANTMGLSPDEYLGKEEKRK